MFIKNHKNVNIYIRKWFNFGLCIQTVYVRSFKLSL